MREAIVNRAFTGHMYYRSPYECYDSCGTCDGGRCETCREKWEVSGWDTEDERVELYKQFDTKEEAQEFADAWEKGEI